MGPVSFGISPECLCHDVRDNVRRVRIRRSEAFIEAGCSYVLWADMSPGPALVARVCADEVLLYLKKKHGSRVAQPA